MPQWLFWQGLLSWSSSELQQLGYGISTHRKLLRACRYVTAGLAGAAQLETLLNSSSWDMRLVRTIQLSMASQVCTRVYPCRLSVHALRAFCPGAQVMDQSALDRKPSLLEPTRSQNYTANDFSFHVFSKKI
jgi:hypothetical protein